MDIVERLRRWLPEESTHELHQDAADEIERLREALQPIAAIDTEKITSALGSGIATKLWVKLNECVELSRKALREKE